MTDILIQLFCEAFEALYQQKSDPEQVNVQKTRPEFKGDFTINVFPFLKMTRKNPQVTATEIGEKMKEMSALVASFEVIQGFLNISLSDQIYLEMLSDLLKSGGQMVAPVKQTKKFVVEYSSPNTNKPLHLGHIRNNLLGHSVCALLKEVGHEVVKVNLVNDRGIHICKSMLAWQKWGNGATPESTGKKGDKLVGDMYVRFSQELKKETEVLISQGIKAEEAEKKASLMLEAREMLKKWEEGDVEVRELWERMNGWVYDGFDVTYKNLGISFDKTYYESQTYLLGKEIVHEGVSRGVFSVYPDQSVRIDLTAEGLDEKVLLRSDGTSVYITQDLGTAVMRQKEYNADEMVYVVGNEQNYHFQVLKQLLSKLGHTWSEGVHHLSYGMVELPEGKMKSREGTVVDADDLMAEMIFTAREVSDESGKLAEFPDAEKSAVHRMIGLGALKYFILKVDPKKNMLFDPRESIEFEGNTGPFIQYARARINSVLRKTTEAGIDHLKSASNQVCPDETEKDLIRQLASYSDVINLAAREMNPGLVANYLFALAKSYNQFYHDHPVLRENDTEKQLLRVNLSVVTAETLRKGMFLLGIAMPERM
ncbi:MAG: arginine--tRNA ligase [Bacteroidetes bacterium HGW-Bacteroidetes-21]|nr:MAG: arginine--tRNA ligase [Bacteroidetes bacterium HGW-Bacteroidetes-21]